MKSTRTILFLLMFVFVSACNSTTPTPIISLTNTPPPIVEVTATSTYPAPTETPTVVPPTAEVFPWKTEAPADFRSCVVSEADLYPPDKNTDSKFLTWLKTLSKSFDPSQFQIVPNVLNGDSIIIPDPDFKHNYTDPAHRPYRMNETPCSTTDAVRHQLRVVTYEFPDPTAPTDASKNIWVVGVSTGMYYFKNNKPFTEADVTLQTNTLINEMNVPTIVNNQIHPNSSVIVPTVDKTWGLMGQQIMGDMFFNYLTKGDPTEFRKLHGAPVLIDIGNDPKYKQ